MNVRARRAASGCWAAQRAGDDGCSRRSPPWACSCWRRSRSRVAGLAAARRGGDDAGDGAVGGGDAVRGSQSARDQEYFGDGIAEELITRLARVPGLKVAARTSAFSFKAERRREGDRPRVERGRAARRERASGGRAGAHRGAAGRHARGLSDLGRHAGMCGGKCSPCRTRSRPRAVPCCAPQRFPRSRDSLAAASAGAVRRLPGSCISRISRAQPKPWRMIR